MKKELVHPSVLFPPSTRKARRKGFKKKKEKTKERKGRKKRDQFAD
jgi:hypothetical protein